MVVATLLMGCGNGANSSSTHSDTRPHLALPTVPSTIADIDARREYLAMHFWDSIDLANMELLQSDSLMGLAITGYTQLLMMNPAEVVERSIDKSLSRALDLGYKSFESLTSRFEDYLYDPNSPMRNEELYIYVLRYTVERAPLAEVYKTRARRQLELALKNRVGERALDFSFESREGVSSTLYATQSEYTILFFNTPDCEECARIKGYIAHSELLTQMVDVEKLTILAIYAEANLEQWRAGEYPEEVVNCADTKGEILGRKLYDLKAMPTLYLLDRDKRVILKDRTINEIENFLSTK